MMGHIDHVLFPPSHLIIIDPVSGQMKGKEGVDKSTCVLVSENLGSSKISHADPNPIQTPPDPSQRLP